MDDAEQREERLKSALWYSIGQVVDHETLNSLSLSGSVHNATPQFIGALTELVWAQIASAGKDLENFAKHAGRSTIQTDDVLLLARRNEGLESLLRSYVDQTRATEGRGTSGAAKGKPKGRK
ncbi:hypothetical protein NA57DRAFT_58593 [Rhizodiscina lignyota]|uniref:Centromere protein S n=1 Tax=Rhizodiscina lignyota TaxID=1504668 RepID=A0A9P4I7Z7_9PEZI|nr:hypothetical protein NA57DRAFT_58593 [Rhizodiscina lignyota]